MQICSNNPIPSESAAPKMMALAAVPEDEKTMSVVVFQVTNETVTRPDGKDKKKVVAIVATNFDASQYVAISGGDKTKGKTGWGESYIDLLTKPLPIDVDTVLKNVSPLTVPKSGGMSVTYDYAYEVTMYFPVTHDDGTPVRDVFITVGIDDPKHEGDIVDLLGGMEAKRRGALNRNDYVLSAIDPTEFAKIVAERSSLSSSPGGTGYSCNLTTPSAFSVESEQPRNARFKQNVVVEGDVIVGGDGVAETFGEMSAMLDEIEEGV